MTLAAGTEAFANEPGESNTWTSEIADNTPLQSQDTYSEAYAPNGTLVGIWRGWDNSGVWISVNHGVPFEVPNASGAAVATNVAPRVVYSNGQFYAFYTGTDGHILMSSVSSGTGGAGPVAGSSARWNQWTIIGGNTTFQSVSLASAEGSGLMMVYRSASDTSMWSAWLPQGSTSFNAAARIADVANPGAGPSTSDSAPTVTYNSHDFRFYATFRGPDNAAYVMAQSLGTTGPTWATSVETCRHPR